MGPSLEVRPDQGVGNQGSAITRRSAHHKLLTALGGAFSSSFTGSGSFFGSLGAGAGTTGACFGSVDFSLVSFSSVFRGSDDLGNTSIFLVSLFSCDGPADGRGSKGSVDVEVCDW